MHNPVQIILDPQSFIFTPDISPGGSKKDFFANRDKEFKLHKESLIEKTKLLSKILNLSAFGPLGVVKVDLISDALAKSHHPVNSIFNSSKTPEIGAGQLGSLYIQANSDSLVNVVEQIKKAELETRWKFNKLKNKDVPNPSSFRSEIGAISNISLYNEMDRLDFDAKYAVNWFSQVNTWNGYVVELFDYNVYDAIYKDEENVKNLFVILNDGLKKFGNGIILKRFNRNGKYNNSYILKITGASAPPIIELTSSSISNKTVTGPLSVDVNRHDKVLSFLKKHPLVKKIYLPPKISSNKLDINLQAAEVALPVHDMELALPTVGLIDTGIRAPQLLPWCIRQSKAFEEDSCDPNHGSNVGSLISFGQALNGDEITSEKDGCRIYDIWCPIVQSGYSSGFFDYFNDFGEFLDFLYSEIKVAKTFGVRVFNMSLNFEEHVSTSNYSIWASKIDDICHELDIQIVLSAGNVDPRQMRSNWPDNDKSLESYLLDNDVIDDRITQPSESVRAITVSALNPPGSKQEYKPTTYTRKGPGVALGVKPDVTHVGGSGGRTSSQNLKVLNGNGEVVVAAGTSFSSPFVSRTLGLIDYKTDQKLSLEALKAVLIHHCNIPRSLLKLSKDNKLSKKIARQFVGFGKPGNTDEMFVTDDHSITMVFESSIKAREEMQFNFVWPKSLVTDKGSCRGKVRLTLVYQPIIDRNYGALFCRNNVEASLRQEKISQEGSSSFLKQVDSIWKVKVGSEATYEKNLLENGLKWWPTKVYERESKAGFGNSLNWQLSVSPQFRRGASVPKEGVKFCLLLTISDPLKKSENLYNEVMQGLQITGVATQDIQMNTKISDIEI